MAETFDLRIMGGTCLTPSGRIETDIGVRDGRTAAIGDLAGASGALTIEAGGLYVLPGVIDTQVHFREPGSEHKEDLESGTRAAVMGGVTAVFEMPNTSPMTTDRAALDDKLDRAAGRAWCDFAFFVGATAENAETLGELERSPGCCGVKVFMGSSTGGLLVEDDETLARVLANGSRRVAVHSEDEPRLLERFEIAENGQDVRLHPQWRDVDVALIATQRLLRIARAAGRRIHVLHISTAEEMPLLAENKDVATVEVTPQHLTLTAPECYDRFGRRAQMNPPIREARHREGLWRAVADGIVDVIGSDHAPHTAEEKDQAYPASPSGMPGVQTLVPVMLTHVNEGRLTLERFVDLTAASPARIYNIANKGRIALGYDADFTLVDLGAERVISDDWIVSKCGWTAFDGMTTRGWPVATVIRGRIVMREDELIGEAAGEAVLFSECLPSEARRP
ncbi:MAG: dihydroorotase [Alphaproteobacteria bacterium]|jgi:dihydroorotase|nr:dihydroorotase [Alphaproteobacteria bacterium]